MIIFQSYIFLTLQQMDAMDGTVEFWSSLSREPLATW